MRMAIIGAQHFHALDLLQTLEGRQDIEWVGICNIASFLESAIEAYHIPHYASAAELLIQARPQAVACFGPIGQRAETIITCLRQGISVLSDKPPVVSFDQLAGLKRALAERDPESGPFFTALFSERYNPPVYTLKKLVTDGIIGQVVNFTAFRPHKLLKRERPSWMFGRESYGGIIVDLTVHDLDVFHWLTGARVIEVAATHSNFTCPEYPEFEDNGQIFFKSDNGGSGFVKVDWLTPEAYPSHGDCRYFVTGTLGTVEVFTGGNITDKAGKVILCTHDRVPQTVSLIRPDTDLYEDFLARAMRVGQGKEVYCEKGAENSPLITESEILETVRVALAARDAADSGMPVRLA